jgi:hypothetical protein
VDGDHTHPNEGDVPKTPEEGDVQKSLDKKMSRRTRNQLAVPAGRVPKTTVNSPPTAMRTKSKVGKKKAKPPEASKPANSQSEKPNDALTQMKEAVGKSIEELKVVTTELKTKVERVEFRKSTTQTRLMKLVTESSPVIAAGAPNPTVTTEAAPPTKVTGETSKEPTIPTPTAAERNPAEDKSEVAKEKIARRTTGAKDFYPLQNIDTP